MKFYDTCALLELQEEAFTEEFKCSDVTLFELENIKTSATKSEDVKYKARHLSKLLDENIGKYKVVVWRDNMDKGYSDRNDIRIMECALYENIFAKDIVFVTNDICCKNIARTLGLTVESVHKDEVDDYTGFIEIEPDDDELAYFYEHMTENKYSLLINQYLIINRDGNVIDTYRWNGETHLPISKKSLKSIYFDKLKCKDVYQSCAVDALLNCNITAISGKAGSGKSLWSLIAAYYLIENGKYDRLVILFNPTKAKGASDMGFYGGTAEEKARQNSIGNILTTKFGDAYAIDMLLQQNKLKLVSMADCRGMEIMDNEILWITEAQNTSIDLLKLCLSRVSSGAKVFIEGDYTSQVDSRMFEGNNNGLKRMIDVFKDHEEFGYVQLQNVWRSRIAELCELL